LNPKEQGLLLLTSHLGDAQRPALTVAQFRLLSQCVRASDIPRDTGELTVEHVMALGYNRPSAQRIISLLAEQDRLRLYLQEAAALGCVPISRISDTYPLVIRKRLGLNSTGCLWAKGDLSLLKNPTVSLVGSRSLHPENAAFAEEAGRQAALQGLTLVSGNARGADTLAQEACLAAGGSVISVVADELSKIPERKGVLYLSEDSFDLPFSPQRALSRNRVIHALGYLCLVAQSNAGFGGTWDGTTGNLRNHISPVYCFDDGSEAVQQLSQMGATLIGMEHLREYSALQPQIRNLIDQ